MRGLYAADLGSTPAQRRRSLSALSDGALSERLSDLARSLRTVDPQPIATELGLPLGEVIASPFGLRMCAMGREVGAAFRPRELRRYVDWTASIDPAVRDPSHDAWERGVLRTGKYQAFTVEAPLAVYDPSYGSKWGPHEILHRAAGYFFRPGLTRWELYLAARLNELVPVTTYYGAEQVMRRDEGAFDRAADGRRPRALPSEARWRCEDDAALMTRARRSVAIFRAGLEHFERELAAIDEELEVGHRVRAAHPFLDASSDATAYVVGHFERLRSPAVARVLEPAGEPDIARYRDQIEALFDRLLFAELDVAARPALARAREAKDLLLRAAHLGEGVEVDLEPLLSEDDPDVVRARLPERIGAEEAALVLADGSPRGLAIDQLAEGLAQATPRTLCRLEGLPSALAHSSALADRGPLVDRVLRHLTAASIDPAVHDLARLEAAILVAERDDGVERLGVPSSELPEDLSGGVTTAHRAAIRLDLAHHVLDAHAEDAPITEGAQTLIVVGVQDAVSVLPVPTQVAAAVAALAERSGPTDLDPEWVRELVGAGVLGWRPR